MYVRMCVCVCMYVCMDVSKYLHGVAVYVREAGLECVVDCCEHLFGIENTARTRLGDKNAVLAHLRHHYFLVELFEIEGDPWFRV